MKKLCLVVGTNDNQRFVTAQYFAKRHGFCLISQQEFGPIQIFNRYKEIIARGSKILLDCCLLMEKDRKKFIELAKFNDYEIEVFVIKSPDLNVEFEKIRGDETKKVFNIGPYVKMLDLRDEVAKYNRYVVVGDLHGCFENLKLLLNTIQFNDETDMLISTGDLVDRGPDSEKVLNAFIQKPNWFCVKGNHDDRFARFLKGNPVERKHGLSATIKSLDRLGDEIEIHKQRYLEYITALPDVIRLPDMNDREQYVVHAGIEPSKPIEIQNPKVVHMIRIIDHPWMGYPWYDENLPNKYRILFGHSVHAKPIPVPNVVALDAGCCFGEKLRAIINGVDIVEVNGQKDCEID